MKRFMILLAAAFAAVAMTACGPEQGEPVITKDGEVTGIPDVAVQPDSTEPTVPQEPIDSTVPTETEPVISTDSASQQSSATVTEPTEPSATAPTATTPTTVSEKETQKTVKTEATTPKATEPPATTPTPDEDDVEDLVDESINIDEYWALLGIDDDDISTDVEP